jgi:C-terminal processing protease CtpA/Prc
MTRSVALFPLFLALAMGCAQAESGNDAGPAAVVDETQTVPRCQPTAYDGVGAAIEPANGGFVFTGLTHAAPAEVAGVRVGDVLRGVDGVAVAGRSFADVHKLLLGPAGSQVVVEVERAGVLQTVPIQRARLQPTC